MRVLTLLAGLCCVVALADCGSQTKTVTVASTPGTAQATPAGTVPAHTGTTQTTGSTTSTTPSSTRTSPEPAFTEQGSGKSPQGAAAVATAVVRAHGFTPNRLSEYHADQTLRVLIGTRTGSGDGYGQRAFFFLEGRYLGTDAKQPSATLKVVSQSDTEVAIAYPLYRHSDPLCCPSGGQAVVHFQLDNGRLAALGEIPPASSASALSRN